MRAYGENEKRGKYILEDYEISRNHTKALAIRRYKRSLKSCARQAVRKEIRDYLYG